MNAAERKKPWPKQEKLPNNFLQKDLDDIAFGNATFGHYAQLQEHQRPIGVFPLLASIVKFSSLLYREAPEIKSKISPDQAIDVFSGRPEYKQMMFDLQNANRNGAFIDRRAVYGMVKKVWAPKKKDYRSELL